MRIKSLLNWTVGFTQDPSILPQLFIPAVVPGAVQLDWARFQNWPPVEEAPLNFCVTQNGITASDYAWMENVYWLYQTKLEFNSCKMGERLFFVCGGVDYKFQVRLHGKVLLEQEGMFTPFELDLTDNNVHSGDILEILVYPAPKWIRSTTESFTAANFSKPLVSYGWDFHPRLVPLGIWRETYLETRPTCYIRSSEIFYQLSDDLSKVDLTLEVDLSDNVEGGFRWTLQDPLGNTVIERVYSPGQGQFTLTDTLDSLELWWPNGQGKQALYTSSIDLIDASGFLVENRKTRVGFRHVRLIMHPGQWEDPALESFPKSRNQPPITLEINGRAIFAKGSNWVSPDIFPGRITTETYRPLLDLAQCANFNLLRCWGGAIVPTNEFFDLCDERGLMVWQDFPLACARYESNPQYLKILNQESCSIITCLRYHPCIVLWCGGNELFNAWSGMTDQDLAIRLLNRNCYDLDPNRPFLMTSPMSGWAHGGYQFKLADGREVYEYFENAHFNAYTEFGIPGPANLDLLKRILPAHELFPPRPGTQWQARHAFNAWAGSKDSWLEMGCIESYFSPIMNLEELIVCGQWLQAEGLKAIFEEARRQKPTCSMALSWCFNEPWPAAANNSLISWRATPKPALLAVGEALRPVLSSARIPKFSWKAGETFTARLFLLNDTPDALSAGQLDAFIKVEDQELFILSWNHSYIAPNQNFVGPDLQFLLPEFPTNRFLLVLREQGKPDWTSKYTLSFRKTDQ